MSAGRGRAGSWSRGAPAGLGASSSPRAQPAPFSPVDLSAMPSLPGNPPPAVTVQGTIVRPQSEQQQQHQPCSPQRASVAQPQPPVDAYVVLDFEATCEQDRRMDAQEIIEFPMVVVDAVSMSIVSEFQRYVRPVHVPVLSAFCTSLTGITQSTVDKAQTFSSVFEQAHAWLRSGNLGLEHPCRSFLFVTCGDWDLEKMLPHQLSHTKLTFPFTPALFSRWINIKHVFQRLYPRQRCGGMPELLKHFGLELVGRHHSGIDDCRNIAHVLIAMMRQGHLPAAPTRSVGRDAPLFVPWNGAAGPWPATTIVPPCDCPPSSEFDEKKVLGKDYQKPTKEAAAATANPAHILPNPKDFPIEYILATEPPPKFNNAQEVTAMSKRIAWALRHNAVKIGLTIDSRGFVPMDEMCAHREFRNKGNLAGLATIAQMDGKSRYRIEYREKEGRFYMGASQGHSIEGVNPDLEVITRASDVPVAVHGTTLQAWALIKTEGLKIMGRQHVHFATGLPGEDGVVSGMRSSSAVLVYLDVAKCLNDGVPLFRSQNGVILCPGATGTPGVIPPQYFAGVQNSRTRESLL
jgi:inhibitor of KinA sporulation pathway (predicted exonuclease)/RNA:NAD 2'-phosphotransferase (TPT1/KptA family)